MKWLTHQLTGGFHWLLTNIAVAILIGRLLRQHLRDDAQLYSLNFKFFKFDELCDLTATTRFRSIAKRSLSLSMLRDRPFGKFYLLNCIYDVYMLSLSMHTNGDSEAFRMNSITMESIA